MWQEFFAEAQAIIQQHSDLSDFDGPVPTSDIMLAQNMLNLYFPDAYRAFLETFGVGSFGSVELYGIIAGKVPALSVPCIVFATDSVRQHPDFPPDFLVVQSSGHGPLFCLATSETVDGDCPVREWNYAPTLRSADTMVVSSFSQHLLNIARQEIQ